EWTATVDEVESVDLVFRAEDVQGNYRDAARPLVGQESDRHIPVYRYVVPETVGTSGVLRDEGTRTEAIALPANIDPTRGELTLRLQSSLAAVTLDGLDYLRNYPHQCIEQTVSRFFPNMMTYRALSDLGIEDPELEAELNAAVIYAVQQLYNWQKADGGWGWFPNDESNPLTTAYALIALAEARRLGFVAQEDVLFRAQQFLRGTFITPRLTTETWQLNRQAFVLYALARSGDADVARTSNLYEFRQRLNLDARAFLMMALHFIDAEDARIAVLRSNLLAEAVMSATGTHWQESYLDYWNWSTNTRTTAIILGALVQTGAESELLPNVVRWLITQREHRAWKTTQATAWSVMALTDWMVATGELYPNYHYSVSINGDQLARETASPETTRDTLELVQNVGDMLIGELNQLEFERSGGDGALYYTAHLEAYLPVPEVEPLNRGIVVERRYVRPTQAGDEPDNTPITQAQAGEIIEVHLTIIAPNNLYYVVVEDPLPAGVEAIDSRLSISQRIGTRPMANRLDSLRNGWNWWWFNEIAMHDEKVVLYSPYLPAGTYEYVYFVRAGVPGVYNVIPATAQEFYFPEVYGRSAGSVFTVLGE
ncbi:MAG TPA: hypothetical protein VK003_05700, partial [Oceanobacillus sp.]|nr:hypothetical protein [Oceanobacillus sp.]